MFWHRSTKSPFWMSANCFLFGKKPNRFTTANLSKINDLYRLFIQILVKIMNNYAVSKKKMLQIFCSWMFRCSFKCSSDGDEANNKRSYKSSLSCVKTVYFTPYFIYITYIYFIIHITYLIITSIFIICHYIHGGTFLIYNYCSVISSFCVVLFFE